MVPPAQEAKASNEYNFYNHGSYRANVPRPSDVLGYEAGQTHTTFRDQERVILAIAEAAKDRVRVVEYGRSVEGRPLRLVLVSSAANIARLDELQKTNAKLADPRICLPNEADAIIKTAPVWTWINHTIHGDETASFEAVLWTLYTLAASDSPQVTDTLDKSVIVLNPAFNPDGHERFVVYYNSVALGSAEREAYEKSVPWAVRGRFNHFRFDLNRDKLAQSQRETQAETQAFLRYLPQVFADEHGQVAHYFFPPNSLPTHPDTGRARMNKWTNIFGRANAQAFDRLGFSYVNRETFDLFYPGYLDSFTSLSGAVGMTYETDAGAALFRKRDDGTTATLRGAVARHVEAGLTTIFTGAQNREDLLRDFYHHRREAVAQSPKGAPRRVVVLPDKNGERLGELADLLRRVGVETHFAGQGFASANAHGYTPDSKMQRQNFPVGSLVVNLEQPQGRVARAFLLPQTQIEGEFSREQIARRDRNRKRNEREPKEEYQFYDITGWALPFTFGLQAFWTEDATPVTGTTAPVLPTAPKWERATVAYLFRYDGEREAKLAMQLLGEGYRVSVATKPLSSAGKEWPRGTFVVRVGRNADSLHERLATLAQAQNVSVTALNTGYGDGGGLGSEDIASLRRPRVAVVADDSVDVTSYGSVWHTLSQAGIEFTALRLRNLSTETLSRYNVLILPDGYGYGSAFGKNAEDLKAWVSRGNVVLGLGSGGTWMASADGLSSARPVGSDSDNAKPDEKTPAKKDGKNKESDKDAEPITTPTRLPGSVFQARLNPEHFLGWGTNGGEIAVPVDGDVFLRPSKTGANPVTFGENRLLLSGWIWPDDTERLLANTAYIVDEPIGVGHALIFLHDPTFRALWPGLRRLVWSSLLFGTLGSSPE